MLVVDDEEPIRNALRKFLKHQQFEVYAASSADEALQQLRLHKIALMLSDIRMPGTSGVDLVPHALEIEPELAILMLTAVNDATSAALCMQRGAMDYLTKPIELADLGRAVQRALKRREMLLENRHLNEWLKEEVTTRTAELHRQQHRMERISTATLEALVNALASRASSVLATSPRGDTRTIEMLQRALGCKAAKVGNGAPASSLATLKAHLFEVHRRRAPELGGTAASASGGGGGARRGRHRPPKRSSMVRALVS